MSTKFKEFLTGVYAHQNRKFTPKVILAFDPGETTGFACMFNGELIEYEQINTRPDSIKDCWERLLRVYDCWASHAQRLECPYEVSCEDYRVYGHKSDSHKWSEVHTIKVVALVQLMTAQKCKFAPIRMRMAAAAKGFVTDAKLQDWGFYEMTKGMKHSRDAVRHACFHAVFPPVEDEAFMPERKSSTNSGEKDVDQTVKRLSQGKPIF